jgi:hypothetical protein
MNCQLRRFTYEGVGKFRDFLNELRAGNMMNSLEDILYNGDFTEKMSGSVDKQKNFESKYMAAKYLEPIIRQTNIKDQYTDVGFWSWLSAFYFDQVCPSSPSGVIRPYGDERYILNTEWNRFYRHLLAAPVMMYDYHRENGMILLYGRLYEMGDFIEQLMSRQDIAQNRELIKVANMLYWNPKESAPVAGVRQKEHRPGTLRRLVDIIQQIDLTFDLYSMKSEEIIGILPREFRRFIPETQRVLYS